MRGSFDWQVKLRLGYCFLLPILTSGNLKTLEWQISTYDMVPNLCSAFRRPSVRRSLVGCVNEQIHLCSEFLFFILVALPPKLEPQKGML